MEVKQFERNIAAQILDLSMTEKRLKHENRKLG
jgi:hypothetical protein